MAKYVYPAIFTPEEDGSILSIFLISTDAIPVETTLRTEWTWSRTPLNNS